jgi:hypothetical protein
MKASDILSALEGDRTRSGTHMHILGSTGVGKSYFLEFLLREAILSGRGFCFVDWHGTTYQRLLNYLTYIRPRRKVVLLNPSKPAHVVGFNPFLQPGDDITTMVARRIDATIKPWGAANTNQTPTLERMLRTAYHFAARAGETLPNAELLLRFNYKHLVDYALSILTEPEDEYVREDLEELRMSRTPKEWGDKVLSTKNRFSRFVGHSGLQTFLGLKEGNVTVRELVKDNAIVLVNLAKSGHLDTEPARVFASLLLNEFREAAMRRAGTKKHYFLALDEFQEYITFDLAAMLDETRKGGVHLVLAHQRLGQLAKDEELQDAVFSNCGVKAVFGGLPFKSASIMANEMHLDRINQRDIKETYYGYHIAGYDTHDEPTETTTQSFGPDAAHPDRLSVTAGKQRVRTPRYESHVSGHSEWSREEKVSKLAQELRDQPRQRCTVKLPQTPTQTFDVPTLSEYKQSPQSITGYERRVYQALNAPTFDDAKLTVQKSREEFLERSRPKKKGDPTKAPFRKNP